MARELLLRDRVDVHAREVLVRPAELVDRDVQRVVVEALVREVREAVAALRGVDVVRAVALLIHHGEVGAVVQPVQRTDLGEEVRLRLRVVVALDVAGRVRVAEQVGVAVEPELRAALRVDAPAVIDHLDDDRLVARNAERHSSTLERSGRPDAQPLVRRGEVEAGSRPLTDVRDAVEVRAQIARVATGARVAVADVRRVGRPGQIATIIGRRMQWAGSRRQKLARALAREEGHVGLDAVWQLREVVELRNRRDGLTGDLLSRRCRVRPLQRTPTSRIRLLQQARRGPRQTRRACDARSADSRGSGPALCGSDQSSLFPLQGGWPDLGHLMRSPVGNLPIPRISTSLERTRLQRPVNILRESRGSFNPQPLR